MQVLLNTDSNIDGGKPLGDHLESVLRKALGRFGEHVTRVDARLTGATGRQATHPAEIHCTLDAKLVGLAPVVVTEQSGNAHQAIQGATVKLERAIGNALAKQDSRRHVAGVSEAGLED